jgi:uncharacterized membrane protein
MIDYTAAKWLHIISSTLLFGTGIGSAYYMLVASLSRDPYAAFVVVRYVVRADWLFTAPTVVFQPLSGVYLVLSAGYSWQNDWIAWSLWLYSLAVLCWLLVVWVQIQMRDLAGQAVRAKTPLPVRYWRLFWLWVALGTLAFFSFVAIFFLMVVKPS